MTEALALTGNKFGRLTVIYKAENAKGIKRERTAWLCHCSCGNEKIISTDSLRAGFTVSCGCFGVKARTVLYKMNTTHGKKNTDEYEIWCSMKSRCFNPKDNGYKNYGGRGIVVCDEWANDFMAFLNHIGERPTKKHSIDRIDNNKSYEPGNVRWATKREQSRNQRSNRNFTHKGKIQCLSAWCEEYFIPYNVMMKRLGKGVSFEGAIEEGWYDNKRKMVAIEAVKDINFTALSSGVVGEMVGELRYISKLLYNGHNRLISRQRILSILAKLEGNDG